MQIATRAMVLADYSAAMDLWKRTEGMALGQSDTEPAVAAFLERNRELSSVAMLPTGELVGALLCGHDGRRGYLHHLAVAPGYRRKRVATCLIGRCLERLTREQIVKCNVLLFADNEEGSTFWLRAGWSVRPDLRVFQKVLV